MRIYWYNAALTLEPGTKEEHGALEVIRKSLETVKFNDGLESMEEECEKRKGDDD